MIKKNKLIYISFILALFLFLTPSNVKAVSYKSDFISINDKIVLETDEFTIALKYSIYNNSTDNSYAKISGYTKKKKIDIYYYHYIIYCYNDNKEEIGVKDGYDAIWDKTAITNGGYFNSILEAKNMNNSYDLSDIKYYKIFIEPADKSVVQNAIYYNSQEGKEKIDDATDLDTTNMIISTNTDFTSMENDATSLLHDTKGNGKYEIIRYHIDMIVNENNTFDIQEQIISKFYVKKHGIYRIISLHPTIDRLDGTTYKNRTKITNIKVNNSFKTYKENGNLIIKIGDSNNTFTGEKSYNISYNYNIGKDPSKDYDELYFNLVGKEWDTTISDFTFTITLPKEFEESNLKFSLGKIGSTNNTNIEYLVEGNVITGKCNRIIKAGEVLTVRLELPEGYYVGATNNDVGLLKYLLFILPIIFAGSSILLWKKYGKDNQIIDTVEFYPPENFNSLEIGFLYKGKADNQDVISLLVYLANKGYIKLSEHEEKVLFSTKKGFKIIKLKDYDGDNLNEKEFLDGLFKKRKVYFSEITFKKKESLTTNSDATELSEVTAADLYNNFYLTMNKIINNINSKENKYKIFEKKASKKSLFIVFMIIATFCLITIPPLWDYIQISQIIIPLFFPGIILWGMIKVLLTKTNKSSNKGKNINSFIFGKIFVILFCLALIVMVMITYILPIISYEIIYLYTYIVGLICIIIMMICLVYLPKRTPYGNEMLGKINGFKNFLETAEKERLEALVMKDPEYFYNILPYTYVLGVSNKWIDKFEQIALQAPNWYTDNTAFNTISFGTFMNSTIDFASNVMSSSPSSSSGGGSAGGGYGGGGGGSW